MTCCVKSAARFEPPCVCTPCTPNFNKGVKRKRGAMPRVKSGMNVPHVDMGAKEIETWRESPVSMVVFLGYFLW